VEPAHRFARREVRHRLRDRVVAGEVACDEVGFVELARVHLQGGLDWLEFPVADGGQVRHEFHGHGARVDARRIARGRRWRRRHRFGQQLLVAEAGDLAKHAVQGHQGKREREAAGDEQPQLAGQCAVALLQRRFGHPWLRCTVKAMKPT